MAKERQHYKVRLNDNTRLEQLLQETYDLACAQHTKLQDEINKIANSTIIAELDIDGKEKYAKIMANYISLQQKSIAQKQDIAKLLAEIVKHGGDAKEAIEQSKQQYTGFSVKELKKLVNDVNTQGDNGEHYNIK